MVQRASSAYVPARRAINGTKGRAEPARTHAHASTATPMQATISIPSRDLSRELKLRARSAPNFTRICSCTKKTLVRYPTSTKIKNKKNKKNKKKAEKPRGSSIPNVDKKKKKKKKKPEKPRGNLLKRAHKRY